MMSLENDQLKSKIWNPSAFSSSFSGWHVKGFFFIKMNSIENRCYMTEIHCLQVWPCIIKPGNFTGWAREEVKTTVSKIGMWSTQVTQYVKHTRNSPNLVMFYWINPSLSLIWRSTPEIPDAVVDTDIKPTLVKLMGLYAEKSEVQ